MHVLLYVVKPQIVFCASIQPMSFKTATDTLIKKTATIGTALLPAACRKKKRVIRSLFLPNGNLPCCLRKVMAYFPYMTLYFPLD